MAFVTGDEDAQKSLLATHWRATVWWLKTDLCGENVPAQSALLRLQPLSRPGVNLRAGSLQRGVGSRQGADYPAVGVRISML